MRAVATYGVVLQQEDLVSGLQRVYLEGRIQRGRKKCLEFGVSRRSDEVMREYGLGEAENWRLDAVSSVDSSVSVASPAPNCGDRTDWCAQK